MSNFRKFCLPRLLTRRPDSRNDGIAQFDEFGFWSRVEGRGSRVQSRGSRVICRRSRVLKNENKIIKIKIKKNKK